MKPLPKWVGVVSAVGALASAISAALPTMTAFIAAPKLAAIAGVCGVIATLSHSLTGTGGKRDEFKTNAGA